MDRAPPFVSRGPPPSPRRRGDRQRGDPPRRLPRVRSRHLPDVRRASPRVGRQTLSRGTASRASGARWNRHHWSKGQPSDKARKETTRVRAIARARARTHEASRDVDARRARSTRRVVGARRDRVRTSPDARRRERVTTRDDRPPHTTRRRRDTSAARRARRARDRDGSRAGSRRGARPDRRSAARPERRRELATRGPDGRVAARDPGPADTETLRPQTQRATPALRRGPGRGAGRAARDSGPRRARPPAPWDGPGARGPSARPSPGVVQPAPAG